VNSLTKSTTVTGYYTIIGCVRCMCKRSREISRNRARTRSCADTTGEQVSLLYTHRTNILQMYYVSIIFFIISLGLSKMSVGALLLRLTPQKQHRRAFNVILALIAAWTIASTFSVALQCNLSHPWILIHESCPRMVWHFMALNRFL